MTKSDIYNECKRLGYIGPVRWVGSTKTQWEVILTTLSDLTIVPTTITPITEVLDDGGSIFLNQEFVEANSKIKYINFSIEDILGESVLREYNMDAFKETIKERFDNVHIYAQRYNPMYQIQLCGRNGHITSVPFTSDINKLFDNINQSIDKYVQQYEDSEFGYDIKYISIRYIIDYDHAIRGAYTSINSSNEKWWVIDTETRTNCVFVALYTCLNWESDVTLLIDSNKRIVNSRKMKERLKIFKDDAPSLQEIEEIAKLIKIHICVYNNIFGKIVEFKYGLRLVEIQVVNQHAKALIRKNKTTHLSEDQLPIVHEMGSESKIKEKRRKMWKINEKTIRETKFIAWDVETYCTEKFQISESLVQQEKFVVYCSGVAYYQDKEIKFDQWFTDDNNLFNFSQWIKDNINWLDGYTFYAHNGGKFDFILLIRDIFQYDTEFEVDENKLLELNNSTIGCHIKYKNKHIYFKDSYRLFQSSLKKITTDMQVQNVKTDLDHNKIKKETFQNYKDEILKYHKIDCVGLLECLDIMSKLVFDTFKINITDCFTAASLSKKICFTHYIDNNELYTLKLEEDIFIRKGFQGGRNECFALGKINNVHYYDFTSLYPNVGTDQLPVGVPVYKIYKDQILPTYNIAFIRCIVRGTKEMLKGVKPLHGIIHNGRFIFSYHDTPIEMTLPSFEIKYGKELGYVYELLDGYEFKRKPVLYNFFNDCFKFKEEAEKNEQEALRIMWKIILNSGFGFWGFNPYNKDTIKLYSKKSNAWAVALHEEKLISIGSFGNKYIARVLNSDAPINTNVAIASNITSLARVKLHRLIANIEKLGGTIYYCDTDSVMTDLKISDFDELMKKYRKDKKGHLLGGLKNELGLTSDLQDRCFDNITIVGCKMYSTTTTNDSGEEIVKSKLKGYKQSHSLDEKNMIDRMNNGETISQIQTQIIFNKSDYVKENDQWEIRINTIKKNFKKLYTKGDIHESVEGVSKITPFTF